MAEVAPVSWMHAHQQKPFSVTGRVTSGSGRPIPDAVISDGHEVVLTDRHGRYRLFPDRSASFIFISIPSGYHIPAKDGVARFYSPVSRDGSMQQVDFVLEKSSEDFHKHAFVVWADPQIITPKNARELIEVSAPDTRQSIADLGNVPVHGVALGDLVHDKFELFPEYVKAVKATGIPFFQVIGNHDMNFDARTDELSQEEFRKWFGPTYYSFNRGKIHYVMLDNVFYIGKGRNFLGYLSEEQLSWLEKDLRLMPKGSTVFLCMHIPTNTREKERAGLKEELTDNILNNRKHLYDILKPYQVHFFSGHTHWNENWELDNMFEHNHSAVCGAWWNNKGVALDGTPNGYAVYEIDGDRVTWHYKSTGYAKTYQFKVYRPGESGEKPGAVVANVWNYDPKWKVEWFENGLFKGEMEQFVGFDPLIKDVSPSYKRVTDHLFAIAPAPGIRKGLVRVTDRFGKVYEQEISWE